METEYKPDPIQQERIANNQCPMCGVPLVACEDSVTKTITGYVFKPGCQCYPEDIRICVG